MKKFILLVHIHMLKIWHGKLYCASIGLSASKMNEIGIQCHNAGVLQAVPGCEEQSFSVSCTKLQDVGDFVTQIP